MVDEAEQNRLRAIERAGRALTKALVELVEAVAMPTASTPSPNVTSTKADPEDVLTLEQVCDATGLSRSTFYNLRVKGEAPPFFVVRNRLRCRRSDLDEWMASSGR